MTLKRYWIWDVLELDWNEFSITLHGNIINLPTSVISPFGHKFRIRQLVSKEPLLLHVMLKKGRTWFSLENNNRVLEEEVTTEIA